MGRFTIDSLAPPISIKDIEGKVNLEIHLYGCGFAGLVSALGLRKQGQTIHAVDTNPERVRLLRQGVLPWKDARIEKLLQEYQDNRLHFYLVGEEPAKSDAAIIAVPTPNHRGDLSLAEIETCLNHIAKHIHWASDPLVLIRSTLPIGGIRKLRTVAEQWARTPQLLYFPEFMREGTGLEDWDLPPLLVIGCDDETPLPKVDLLLGKRDYLKATSAEAEVLKLASNAFHATKVSFANEVMRICEPLGISSETVMDLFCQDKKLNLSEKYLKPGFAWGGPCLGKDIRSLVAVPQELPLIQSLEISNSTHLEFFKEKILKNNPRFVAMIGLSFKPEVDDTRQSPILHLAESLALTPQVQSIAVYDPSADPIAREILIGEKFQWVESISDLNDADVFVVRENLVADVVSVLGDVPRVEI